MEKRAHIRAATSSNLQSFHDAMATAHFVNRHVRIAGLRTKLELNECIGIAFDYDEESQRYSVLAGGMRFKIKADNLRLFELQQLPEASDRSPCDIWDETEKTFQRSCHAQDCGAVAIVRGRSREESEKTCSKMIGKCKGCRVAYYCSRACQVNVYFIMSPIRLFLPPHFFRALCVHV